ncbi:MAG: pyruvate kinase [Planctomycetes bacterium]|jgi:pyruvate kinase|nr:pyruvate kinase [Planctomycetota bacterium]MBT6540313.1 pyruvate kinase [Planctomycetota bacterium]MBT6784001.1 pyruvate kinase [Planctomycetota bacterium]MBT6967789.1 pyruvate kinase [Planctomycetota bacterium]MBT7130435.1 pyruvate kinase [Planctomycetota bacterium]
MESTHSSAFRQTKIVGTLGPASNSEEVLRGMFEAGLDVVRINASHGAHKQDRATIEMVREIAVLVGRPIGILYDLQGPKIRLSYFEGDPIPIEQGEEIRIAVGRTPEINEIGSDYDLLDKDLSVGDPILIDDGNIAFETITVEKGLVIARAANAGLIHPRKGINLPGSHVSAPAITEKDREDAIFAASMNVDFIALSFVRKPEDVIQLRDLLASKGSNIPIISKIEKPLAVENITQILENSWGAMVARGDLGVEIPPERVPVIQKRIISEGLKMGRPTITATQMLDSMTRNPRPTRAEASDVANAVLDGTDAVMLSGETAIGDYPIESVRMMSDVIHYTEQNAVQPFSRKRREKSANSPAEAVTDAGCQVAHDVDAHALCAFTRSGSTALRASRRRPERPILAFTTNQTVRDRLTLVWGVRPYQILPARTTDELIQELDKTIQADEVAAQGDLLVLLMGAPTHRMGKTNLMLVYRVGSWTGLEGPHQFEDEDE